MEKSNKGMKKINPGRLLKWDSQTQEAAFLPEAFPQYVGNQNKDYMPEAAFIDEMSLPIMYIGPAGHYQTKDNRTRFKHLMLHMGKLFFMIIGQNEKLEDHFKVVK